MSSHSLEEGSSQGSSRPLSSAWSRGKLILLGEHSVVYGQPAIGIALQRGLELQLYPGERSSISFRDPRGDWAALGEGERLLNTACRFLEWSPPHPLRARISGPLPIGAGLGGSAAMAVALLRALAPLAGYTLSESQLLRGAAVLEGISHGRASGIDHTISVLGGALRFQRDGDEARWRRLKVQNCPKVVISWVSRRGSTREVVNALREKHSERPQRYDALFKRMGSLTDEAEEALLRGDWGMLGLLLDESHAHLIECGVSDPRLEEGVALMRDAGAMGAKLSGAGWGGAFFGLVHHESDAVERALQQAGLPCWSPRLELSY